MSRDGVGAWFAWTRPAVLPSPRRGARRKWDAVLGATGRSTNGSASTSAPGPRRCALSTRPHREDVLGWPPRRHVGRHARRGGAHRRVVETVDDACGSLWLATQTLVDPEDMDWRIVASWTCQPRTWPDGCTRDCRGRSAVGAITAPGGRVAAGSSSAHSDTSGGRVGLAEAIAMPAFAPIVGAQAFHRSPAGTRRYPSGPGPGTAERRSRARPPDTTVLRVRRRSACVRRRHAASRSSTCEPRG